MKKTSRKIKKMCDYQKFANNEKLDSVINDSTCKEELSVDQLTAVAAGRMIEKVKIEDENPGYLKK